VLLVYVARFTRLFGTGAELLRVTSLSAIVVFVFQTVALAILMVVIWQVEKLMREKAATVAAAPAPAGPAEAGA